jgi:pilus assembly protein CpaC
MVSSRQARAKRARRISKRKQAMSVLFAASMLTSQILFGQEPAPIVNARAVAPASAKAAAYTGAPQATANPFVQSQDQPSQDQAASSAQASSAATESSSTGSPSSSASSRRMAKERGVEGPAETARQDVPIVKAKPLPANATTASQPQPVKTEPHLAPIVSAKEHLAPIVSASSMPKRPRGTAAASKAKTTNMAAVTPAATPAATTPEVRVELKPTPTKGLAAADAKPVAKNAAAAPTEPAKSVIANSAAPSKSTMFPALAKAKANFDSAVAAALPASSTPAKSLPSLTATAKEAPGALSALPPSDAPAALLATNEAAKPLINPFVPASSAEANPAPAKVAATSPPAVSASPSPVKESSTTSPSDFETRLANGPQASTSSAKEAPPASDSSAPAPAQVAAAVPQSIPTEAPPVTTALPANLAGKTPTANTMMTPSSTPTASGPMAARNSGAGAKAQPIPGTPPGSMNGAAANVAKSARQIFEPLLPSNSSRQGVRRAEFETPLPLNARQQAQHAAARPSNESVATRQRSRGPQAQVAGPSRMASVATQPTAPLAVGNPQWSQAYPSAQIGTPTPAPVPAAESLVAGGTSPGGDFLPEMGLPPLPPQSLQSSSAPAGQAMPVADASHEERGKLPEGMPFEAIKESGTVKLRAGLPLLLRMKSDVYRTAIVDDQVCNIERITMREISIVPRTAGRTHVTFFFDDPQTPQLTYLLDVLPGATP